MFSRLILACFLFAVACINTNAEAVDSKQNTATGEGAGIVEFEYKLLATNRTSTMEKEINEAASAGYHFAEVISGATFFGGSEALVVMVRSKDGDHATSTNCSQRRKHRPCRRSFKRPGMPDLSTVVSRSSKRLS